MKVFKTADGKGVTIQGIPAEWTGYDKMKDEVGVTLTFLEAERLADNLSDALLARVGTEEDEEDGEDLGIEEMGGR